ncbi:heavy-metal-associated domain-containing protein [Namhaeicola litoreus]|uniref:Heavy-metal-associated domain-containing protein n=1 Tax=Namhaeicola litoreus TaxID=1052145 RepID=A0ABW3XWW7_9FLAO
MQKLIFILSTTFLLLFFSCTKSDKEFKLSQKEVVKEIKKVEVDIEGMTCEIGCAKLIESKLSKTEGVQLATVSFEQKKGVIEFDANLIDEKRINDVIEATGGGDLYTVVRSQLVE